MEPHNKSLFFEYPWLGLEGYLADQSANTLNLFGYGSLMNKQSASLTFSVADSMLEAAVVQGVRRVFDYPMPPSAFERHGSPLSPRHVGALNMHPTGNTDDTANGLVVSIPDSSLDDLRRRELGYDMIGVAATSWESGATIAQPVFMLSSNNIDKLVLPHVDYVRSCEAGARSISTDFLAYFRQTSFLADGTRLEGWEAGDA